MVVHIWNLNRHACTVIVAEDNAIQLHPTAPLTRALKALPWARGHETQCSFPPLTNVRVAKTHWLLAFECDLLVDCAGPLAG